LTLSLLKKMKTSFLKLRNLKKKATTCCGGHLKRACRQ